MRNAILLIIREKNRCRCSYLCDQPLPEMSNLIRYEMIAVPWSKIKQKYYK